VAEHLLKRQLKFEKENSNNEMVSLIKSIQQTFKISHDEQIIDYDKLATQWLELLTPILREKRSLTNNKKYFTLNDLKTHYKKRYFEFEQLERLYNKVPLTEAIDSQLAVCIIGVGQFALL
jgi:hypothetical protein